MEGQEHRASKRKGRSRKGPALAGLKPGAYMVDGALARLATRDYFRSSLA
jgi:hypothetical protein